MIRKTMLAAAVLLASLSLAPIALAANLTVKDGAGITQTICARTQTDGSLAECHVILDTTNTQIDPATKQLQQSTITALGSPFQAGGSIGNTGFAINGLLPAFTSPPTVNLGTLNGAALDATLQAIKTLLGSAPAQDATLQAIKTLLGTAPLQAGGHVNVDASALPAGAAADATLQSIKTLLGAAPAQAGGKIDTVINSASVDRGAVLATASTAVTLMPANSARRGLSLGNQSSSNCWFNGVATATADYHSTLLPALTLYESKDSHVGNGAISVICTAANASVSAREW